MALENQIGDLRQVIADMNNTIVEQVGWVGQRGVFSERLQERKLEAAAKRLEEEEESDWLRDGAFGGESPRRSKKDLERVIENLKQSLVKVSPSSKRPPPCLTGLHAGAGGLYTHHVETEGGDREGGSRCPESFSHFHRQLRGRLSEMKIAGVNSEDSSFTHQVDDIVLMSVS